MKKFTPSEVLAAVNANMDRHMETLARFPEGAELDRISGGRYRHCWACGEWLAQEMANQGFSDDAQERACVALGQLSLFGDPYTSAANLLSKAIDGNPQQPGEQLADEINARHIMQVESGVLITREAVLTTPETDPVVTVRAPKGEPS